MAQTINFSNTTPSAPAGGVNVLFQSDSSSPPNISAYMSSVPTGGGAILKTQFPSGVTNFNTSAQATQLTAATPQYVAGSFLPAPNPAVNGIVIGTAYTWRIHLSKNGAGTGQFEFLIYMGTAGTTSDTAEVTQSIGIAQTAAVDEMTVDISVIWTAVGASTASFYWSIAATHTAASTAGFGITAGTLASWSGTVSSLNSTTTGLGFGIAVESAAGGTMETPAFTYVVANAYNLD